jgi:hypothetical protein
VRGGSGGQPGGVARGEKTARLRGAVAQGWGGTWLGPEQRRDGRGAAHGRQSGGGAAQRGNGGGGGEVDEGGLDCNFQKVQGPYCNEDGPKSKSVGFFKIYNFALRLIHKKAKDLELI